MKKSIMKAAAVGAALAAFLATGSAWAAGELTAAQTAKIEKAVKKSGGAVFPIGNDNVALEKYFTGKTYLARLGGTNVRASNVTFEPGVINHWHTHQGSCQILVGVSGKGYAQIWGQPAVELVPGVTYTIPENVKHWHGAAHKSWFQHLSIMQAGSKTTWLEPVDQKEYDKLK